MLSSKKLLPDERQDAEMVDEDSDIIDGENRVVEAGWFNRGMLLMLTGWKNGDMFRCRSRKKATYPQLCKITKINGKFVEITDKRYGED